MVTNKTIKFFKFDNTNSPQLQNSSGSMITVLDACLITGISVGTIIALTSNQLEAIAVFSAPHNLKEYQVITISGVAQSEYNGDFRLVEIINETTVKFNLITLPSVTTATGSITCKLTPLNWDKPFSSTTALGGGRAAYRSKDTSLSNRPYLRVVDERISNYDNNFAKYAKVGIVETMTNINTMSGVQAPYTASDKTRNWNPTGSGSSIKNGWAKWYYYTMGEYGVDSIDLTTTIPHEPGPWFLIGNDTCFYLLTSTTNDSNLPITNRQLSFLYGFGNFDPIADDDLFSHFLIATNLWETANGINYRSEAYTNSVAIGSYDASATSTNRSVFLQRGYKKSSYSLATCSKVSLSYAGSVSGGLESNIVNDSAIGGVILQTPVVFEIISSSQFLPRGFLPLIKTIPHKSSYEELQIIKQDSNTFLAKKVYGTSSIPEGIVVFDLGGINGY